MPNAPVLASRSSLGTAANAATTAARANRRRLDPKHRRANAGPRPDTHDTLSFLIRDPPSGPTKPTARSSGQRPPRLAGRSASAEGRPAAHRPDARAAATAAPGSSALDRRHVQPTALFARLHRTTMHDSVCPAPLFGHAAVAAIRGHTAVAPSSVTFSIRVSCGPPSPQPSPPSAATPAAARRASARSPPPPAARQARPAAQRPAPRPSNSSTRRPSPDGGNRPKMVQLVASISAGDAARFGQ